MRTLYHEEPQKNSLQHGIPDTWTDVASLLTQTAAKVFGFTERTRHKPWFLGRYNEILAFNQRISVAKQAFITAAADAQQDPHKQQKRAAHCHALTQAKRIKRRTFTGWE
jgi:hypothetical protein